MKSKFLSFILLGGMLCLKPFASKAQVTSPAPYCDASFDDMQGFPVDDHINSVSFGTLNNSTNAQYAAPHYVHYNNLANATFIAGNTYNLAVNFYVAGGCGYGVWIDYNYNFIFEANEKVAGTTGNNYLTLGTTSITQSITIPASVASGNTRMRVRLVEDDNHHMTSTDELPCNASTSATDVMDWGETEDYTITIQKPNGINQLENSTISVFPNPASESIYVDNEFVGSKYLIQSMNGQTILSGVLTTSNLDIHNLTSGSYLFIIEDKKNKISHSLLIKQ